MLTNRFLTAIAAVALVALPGCNTLAQPAQPAALVTAEATGGPEDNLPPHIEQLTWFGERASWSPDGKRMAFMAKSFGDAFEVDLDTRNIRLLTHYPNPGYLRVQYLPNGDYLLVGAREFENVRKTRFTDQELWVLKAGSSGEAIPLDQKLTEGVAISRDQMKIAWAVDPRTHPDEVPERTVMLYTGDIVEQDGKPVLTNKRVAVHLTEDCPGAEPQDFRNNDRELIFVCYNYDPKVQAITADVRGVSLKTGEVTTYLSVPDEYNEVEGLYPSGEYALVESSRDQETATSRTIDIWKLPLDNTGTGMVRLTHWGDYDGYKASNPVVSPDGSTIAFQSAKSTDEAGVGYGLFLMKAR